MDESASNTPTKMLYHMSQSCNDICILFQEIIRVTSSKPRLWSVSNEKTVACFDLEECIGVNISKNQDFQVICSLFEEKIKTLDTIRSRKELFFKSRAIARQILLGKKQKTVEISRLRWYQKEKIEFHGR